MSLCPDSITHFVCVCVFNVFVCVHMCMCKSSTWVWILLWSHWPYCAVTPGWFVPSPTHSSVWKDEKQAVNPLYLPSISASFVPTLFLTFSHLILTVVFHQEPGSQKEQTKGETYRFTTSRACHYWATAHQQINQRAGALIDASDHRSGSNKPSVILSP